MGEEARESHREAQDTSTPNKGRRAQPFQTQNNNDTQGDTGGSTITTLKGPDEDACTNMQVHGFVAHQKNVAQLD
jgi:hypothetical protein